MHEHDIHLHAILDNTPGSTVLPGGPCRVLWFVGDRVSVIDLPRKNPDKAGRMLGYVGGPRFEDADTLKAWLRARKIFIHNGSGHTAKNLKDADFAAAARTARERTRVATAIRRRDQRWAILKPLVVRKDKVSKEDFFRSASELLADPKLSQKIVERAKKAKCSVTTVYNLLHRYWAGGGKKNALYTNHDRCGNPGHSRPQQGSQGRKTRLLRAEKTAHRCYVLDRDKGLDSHLDEQSEKQKLAWGWRLIRHGMSRKDAFVAVSGVFWADHLPDGKGGTRAELWEPHLRPTFDQFVYWGRRLNGGLRIAEALLGVAKRAQKTEARGGSEQDMVVAVGQLAVFDGTKTDVYLTSRHSRLKKLPPMLRLIIKDVRTGVICGWYLGWEAASPQTAIQAIFHAASSKVEECRRLGIEVSDDIIPAILHRNYLADNGELKAEAATEFENQFCVGILYTPAGRGDRKGGVESQHHKDHKLLDHKLPGTTRGKQRDRGEDHPALSALLNSYEYRREFMEHVIANNTEVVPDLAPTEMRVSEPDLALTRANIFRWLRRRQSGEAPSDIDALRAFALPDVDAVVRKNGIYPLFNVLGTKVIIPRFRFSSPELIATGLMSDVKRTGKSIRTRIKMAESLPDQAWLPSKDGMVPLRCATRPERIQRTLSTADWKSLHEDRLLRSDLARPVEEQARLNTLQRRHGTQLHAAAQLRSEIAALGKKPSKKSQVSNLDENLADEQRLDAGTDGPATKTAAPATKAPAKTQPPPAPKREAPPAATPETPMDPAALAMANLNSEEFADD